MFRCEDCTNLLLDHQYGLLDPAAAAAVEAHLVSCGACRIAAAAAAREQILFATAAKWSFPQIIFVAPVEPKVAARPASPAWLTWVVAAAVLLAVGVTAGPAGKDWLAFRAAVPAAEVAVNDLAIARAAETATKTSVKAEQDAAVAKLAAARRDHDAVATAWVNADAAAYATRPFTLHISGPTAAVPGAPNDYAVAAADAAGKPVDADVTVTIRDAAGAVIRTLKVATAPGNPVRRVRLPADLWATFPDGADGLTLAVTATDPKTGATADLAEPVKLLAPVFTTFLVTDKPLYQPGEPVFFRSLTLGRLRPPVSGQTFRYEIRTPAGTPLPDAALTGTTLPTGPAAAGGFTPVTGPDGKPVTGVGCGAFVLPAELPGGEYTLTATQIPPGYTDVTPPAGTAPAAVRKFLVRRYTPERLQKTLEFAGKSFGPGETVRAKLTAKEGDKPAADVALEVTVTAAAGEKLAVIAPLLLNPDGSAEIAFTLPAGRELASASLAVRLSRDGLAEAIVRPVPLASKTLNLEFFPEGGDLVVGLPTRVYFRATTPAGRPADVLGYLIDGTRSICEVKTLTDPDYPGANQGHGVFAFTPEAGKRYFVKLIRPSHVVEPVAAEFAAVLGGIANVGGYPLPEPAAAGVVMTIPGGTTGAADPVRVGLISTQKVSLFVGAYARGVPVASGRVVLEPGKPAELVLMPKPGAAGGVTRITAFAEPEPGDGRDDLKPVAERLIYRRPVESLNLTLTPDRATYAPGDRVNLNVAAADETGRPTAAILWAAVTNESVRAMAADAAEHALPTHFLLSGEVQKPDQLEHADFFLTAHPRAGVALDLLLGTQGWRRFVEQTPGRFRATVPAADRDRFLISTGAKAVPLGRDVGDPIAAKFRPAYETAAAAYRAAGADLVAAVERAARVETSSQSDATAAAANVVTTGDAASLAADRAASRRGIMPILLGGLVAGCMVLVALRKRIPYALAGVAVLLAAGGFVLFADAAARTHADWRPVYSAEKATAEQPPPVVVGKTVSDRIADIQITRGSLESVQPGQSAVVVRRPVGALADPADEPEARLSMVFPIAGDRAAVLLWLEHARNDWTPGTAAGLETVYRRHANVAKVPPAAKAAVKRIEQAVSLHPPVIAREFAYARPTAADADRQAFPETVYWHPVLVLPADGRTTLSFQLGDADNPFRALVAGHTLDGRLGSTSVILPVRKADAIATKLPSEIGFGDRIHVSSTGRVTAVTSDQFQAAGPDGKGGFTLAPKFAPADAVVRLSSSGDAVRRTIRVTPDGFPIDGAAGGTLADTTTVPLDLPPQIVPGTLVAKLTLFANPLADVTAGLDGVLKEPHGCFEQSSSANYPNVLALDYIKRSGAVNPAAAERAHGLLDRGYTRLSAFEVPKAGADTREGFEWFGHAPAHESLTAYGLMQFADMGRVHPVDPALIDRTRAFLLARRDGSGGFRPAAVPHNFGAVPANVVNAYTLWAITESERGSAKPSDLAKELDAAVAAAGADSYVLALVALALVNRADARSAELLQKLAGMQKPDGSVPAAAFTITRSAGPDAVTEPTALAALAWHRGGPAFAANAAPAMKFLATRRTAAGTFGATQATVLALKAVVETAPISPAAAGPVTVRVAGKTLATLKLDPAGPTEFAFPDAESLFKTGRTDVTLELPAGGSVPFTIGWTARTTSPPTDPKCAVRISAKLDRAELREAETCRLTVRLTNTTGAGQGMAVAVVGLPAGLRIPADSRQLKDLAAAGTIDYWEAAGRDVTLYRRGMGPNEVVEVTLDLIADFPGDYRGPVSRAYLYYHPQSRAWADPVAVRISPAGS